MSYTYGDYLLAQIVGGIAFTFVIGVLASVISCAPLFKRAKGNGYNSQETHKRYRYAKLTVKWLLPYVKKEVKDGKEIIVMLKEEVHVMVLPFLAIVVITIICITSLIFWIVFFIEESIEDPTTCPAGFDCYPIAHVSKTYHHHPVDCSKYTGGKFICYRFACNIGNAVGNATATLGFSWIGATMVIWFVHWTAYHLKKCTSSFIAAMVTWLFIQLPMLIAWIGLIIVDFHFLYRDRSISLTCALQIFSFSILMCGSTTIPWHVFFKNVMPELQCCQCCSGKSKFWTFTKAAVIEVQNAVSQTIQYISRDEDYTLQKVIQDARISKDIQTNISQAFKNGMKKLTRQSAFRDLGEYDDQLDKAQIVSISIAFLLTKEVVKEAFSDQTSVPHEVHQAVQYAITKALVSLRPTIEQAVEDASSPETINEAALNLLKQINNAVNGAEDEEQINTCTHGTTDDTGHQNNEDVNGVYEVQEISV